MVPDEISSLWGQLFDVAPYLASLIALAFAFTWLLVKVRAELKKDIKAIEEKLEHKIDEGRTKDIIKTIISPVIAGLKGIRKISADNAETLKEMNKDVHELSKDALAAETEIDNLKGKVNRLEDKVYD